MNLGLRWLIVRVLGDEFSLDGKSEDGFTKVGRCDGVGRVEEEIEVRRGGRIRKAGKRGAGKSGVPGVAFLLLRLQPITQGHQLIHLRHNPLLLGKGGRGTGNGSRLLVKCGFSLCQLPGLSQLSESIEIVKKKAVISRIANTHV